MKKKMLSKIIKATTVFLITSAIVTDTVIWPLLDGNGYMVSAGQESEGGASKYQASFIDELDKLTKLEYEDYLDNSVMFKLPEGIKDDEEISVIVSLDVINIMDAYENTNKTMSFKEFALESDEAAKIEADIADEKKAILEELDDLGIEYSLGEDYSTIISGFELLIKAGDFEKTCKSMDDDVDVIVSEVYEASKTEVVENPVKYFESTGIFDSSESGYDGSGMVVAVLDTGLDSAHTAFSVDNFKSTKLGLTYEEVAEVLSQSTANKLQNGGLTVDDVYINEKVPFGFDYADNDPDVYSTHNNHGTHVSGVIVGKDDTITGVAPNAQLVSM